MKSQLLKNFSNDNRAKSKEQEKLQEQFVSVKNQIDKKSDEIENMTFSAKSGGGAVEVTVKGNKNLSEFKILDDNLLKVENKEMLQDLIVSVVNEANSKVDNYTDDEFSKITQGLPNFGF